MLKSADAANDENTLAPEIVVEEYDTPSPDVMIPPELLAISVDPSRETKTRRTLLNVPELAVHVDPLLTDE